MLLAFLHRWSQLLIIPMFVSKSNFWIRHNRRQVDRSIIGNDFHSIERTCCEGAGSHYAAYTSLRIRPIAAAAAAAAAGSLYFE